jgi:hypothetical protein
MCHLAVHLALSISGMHYNFSVCRFPYSVMCSLVFLYPVFFAMSFCVMGFRCCVFVLLSVFCSFYLCSFILCKHCHRAYAQLQLVNKYTYCMGIKTYNNLPPYIKKESHNPRKFKTYLLHFLHT